MYSRPDQRYAALDTHILKWLRSRGHDVPKSTPSSKKKYKEIEQLFLFIADDLGVDPSVLDSFIWQKYSRGTKDGAV
jgi:thermostable 8-oxoguanine DNA glycosylase